MELVSKDSSISAVSAIDLMPEVQKWLSRFSNGPVRPHFLGRNTVSLIAMRTIWHPDRIAVAHGARSITYQDLSTQSDKLASALLQRGVRPGDRIAVLLKRNVSMRGPTPALEKLVAWITVPPGGEAPAIDNLREFLSKRLPVYLLPSDINVIAGFPLNSSGKVDVRQLPNPEIDTSREEKIITDTEMRLIQIWIELLARPSVHPDDDWFHIGGHLLLVLRLFARIHENFQVGLPISVILDNSTPRLLASIIDQTEPEK